MTLNPVLSIAAQMVETILAHENVSRDAALDERARRWSEWASRRRMSASTRIRTSFPEDAPARRDRDRAAQQSGSHHRRRAHTALDVTIQGQILFEMQKLTRETGAAMIWITHDLSVVAGLADRICVMYAGRIVEQGTVVDVLTQPRHPYTQGLLDSVPSRSRRGARLKQIPGMAPPALELPTGCAFRARCAYATNACEAAPEMRSIGPGGHALRCFHPLGLGAQP